MTATETIAIMGTDPYTRAVALETMPCGRSDIVGIGYIAGIIEIGYIAEIIGIGEGTGMTETGNTAEILNSGFLSDIDRIYRLQK